MLINKRSVRDYALSISKHRAKVFTRVSKDFYITIENKLKEDVKKYVLALPSFGKTIS